MWYILGIAVTLLGVVLLLVVIVRNLIRLGRRQQSHESLWMLDQLEEPEKFDSES